MTKPPMEEVPVATSAQEENPAVKAAAIADSERLRKLADEAAQKADKPKKKE